MVVLLKGQQLQSGSMPRSTFCVIAGLDPAIQLPSPRLGR
jgi:hypothetical protein